MDESPRSSKALIYFGVSLPVPVIPRYSGYRTASGAGVGAPADSWTNVSVGPMGWITASEQYPGPSGGTKPYGFTYEHYQDGSLASLTSPSKRTVTYCYDAVGRITWLSPASTSANCTLANEVQSPYASGITYWPHGPAKEMTYGSGLTEAARYNNRLQTAEITLKDGGTLLWQVGYQYQRSDVPNNGNVLAQTTSAAGMSDVVATYAYDGANRLSVVAEQPVSTTTAPVCSTSGILAGGWCHKYGYDRWGNRSIVARQSDTEHPTEVFSFDPVTNRNSGTGWEYGTRGEILKDPAGARYAYDVEGRMAMVCPSGATSCSTTWAAGKTGYVYDADGRRVRKRANTGSETVYVYDAAGQLAAEYGSSVGTVGTQYLTADALGSTRVMTDATSKAVVERHDYQPFGDEIAVASGSPRYGVTGYGADTGMSLKFTGKERDTETGLDYFGARYFSGAQGRFTSPDPQIFGAQHLRFPQKWNKYAYARNSPLIFIDPDGWAEYYVFLPEARGIDAGWQALRAKINNDPNHTNHMTVYPGAAATVERFQAARNTSGSVTLFSGHSVDNPQVGAFGQTVSETAGSVHLGNGDIGTMSTDATRGATPATGEGASIVALLGCNTLDLASQYSNTSYTSMLSGLDFGTTLQAMNGALLAYAAALSNGGTLAAATAAAQAQINASPYWQDHTHDTVVTVPAIPDPPKLPDPETPKLPQY